METRTLSSAVFNDGPRYVGVGASVTGSWDMHLLHHSPAGNADLHVTEPHGGYQCHSILSLYSMASSVNPDRK